MSLPSFDFCSSVPCLSDHGCSNTSAVAGGCGLLRVPQCRLLVPQCCCWRQWPTACAPFRRFSLLHQIGQSLAAAPRTFQLHFSSCYIFISTPTPLCLNVYLKLEKHGSSECCSYISYRLLGPLSSSLYLTHCGSRTMWTGCSIFYLRT